MGYILKRYILKEAIWTDKSLEFCKKWDWKNVHKIVIIRYINR